MRPEFSDNGDEIFKWLQGLRFTDKQIAKIGRLIGGEMVYQTEERFSHEYDLGYSPWVPSQRAIIEQGQTLSDTGRLRTSLNFRPLPDGVEWGTNVVYARMMHYGGKKSQFPHLWGDVAGRAFLGINENDKSTIQQIIYDVLEESGGK